MAISHNLGFPRIGENRELKSVLESFWRNETTHDDLRSAGKALRCLNWQDQSGLDLVPVGDFSLYDQVLDMSFTLGSVPARARRNSAQTENSVLDDYFRVARGSAGPDDPSAIQAGALTKWFDTNYHYIVPEFDADTTFALDPSRLLLQLEEAQSTLASADSRAKPVLIGPVSYLWLGKSTDDTDRLALLDKLLPVYAKLLEKLAAEGIEWVQIDEPILATELDDAWSNAFETAYSRLGSGRAKILLAVYFGPLKENLELTARLPVSGVHIDALTDRAEAEKLVNLMGEQIVSLGVINGRNVWKTDLEATLDWLEPLAEKLGDRLWIAPSCSLLHVPVDLESEQNLDPEISGWLAFARQKLLELGTLHTAINQGRDAVSAELNENASAIASRRRSTRVSNPEVAAAVRQIGSDAGQRQSAYGVRAKCQAERFGLPQFPTTTIGSFPQTADIRKARRQFRIGELSEQQYRSAMEQEIARSIQEQEALDLDVLVHGEAERNDMVEYFGQQLEGYAISQAGWVQSYGSRCVKPPIVFGDISRPKAMTVEWTRYAQSLTSKRVKGMLTGPVTILNWSFVRDDQPRSETCLQISLAIRKEVQDLEAAGVQIIQIDEAALREGLPLRKSEWPHYLDWAVGAFRVAANGVKDETQIHTHMCYSDFNDIIESIAAMDADVITIETSRSDMVLLDAFDRFKYPNAIGPGVYDIHSPNIPSVDAIVNLMEKAADRIPAERLWVNPDCGLKTRRWEEVLPALRNMVSAAKVLRSDRSAHQERC